MLLGFAIVAPCAWGQPPPSSTAGLPSYAEFGYLPTELRDVRRPNCWTLVLRGRLTNPYDAAISGARLIVRLQGPGEQPREIERLEVRLGIDIDAGRSVGFSRELTTACTSSFSGVLITAFASRLGEAELPTPSREIEIAAGQFQASAQAFGFAPHPSFGGWAPK